MRKRTLLIALSAMALYAGADAAAGAQQDTDDPRLDTRVTISYQNAAATDVLFALGRAGDLRTNMTTSPLLPVTVTLTNVKLRTALDAVCQNAGCYWQVEKAGPLYPDILLMRIRALEEPLASIPKTVSLALNRTPVSAVFRALAAALNVTLVLETELAEGRSSNWDLQDASTSGVLDLLCDIGNCSWELNEKNRTLRVFARKR